MPDDKFEPKLGEPQSRGGKSAKRHAHQALAVIDRTSVPVTALTNRDCSTSVCRRRVIGKARVVRLAGKGMDPARAHR